MKKHLILIVTVLLLFTACTLNSSEDVIGQLQGSYVCSNDYFAEDYFNNSPQYKPSITFYADGTCEVNVNYLHGIETLKGNYTSSDDTIEVSLTLSSTFINDTTGENYMSDKYVFQIIDENTISIDTGFYAVNSGDSFIKE